MPSAKDRRRQRTNRRTLLEGLACNGIATIALYLAHLGGLARIDPRAALGMFGLGTFNYVVFSLINAAKKEDFTNTFMRRFFWAAMTAQLAVYGYGALIADAVRPVALIISMVAFAMLFHVATFVESLLYCTALGLLFVSSSWVGSSLLGQQPRLVEDLYWLLIWAPVAALMAYLVGRAGSDRAIMVQQRRELKAREAQIRALDEQKTRFFRNISHELRTPLTMILSPLAQELEKVGGEGTTGRNLAVAHRNALRLYALVDQLLELQALEASERAPDPSSLTDIELGAFAQAFTESYYATGTPRGVRVEVRQKGPVYARGQVDGLETILFNYVSNALKYSPDGGLVTVEVDAPDGQPRLLVSDQGPGIAPEHLPRLFQEFSQVSQGPDRRQGTGLGLALVRRLVTRMGGEAGVDSTVGEGCRFWVRLPKGAPCPSPPGPAPATRETARGRALLAAEAEEPWGTGPAADPSEDFLLVAEDQADLRRHLVELLSPFGAVVGVPDGRTALDRMQQRSPRLVVTDWMMPRMTGTELIEAMRADPRLGAVPVVLLTANSDEGSRMLGSTIGADVFLGKPFDRAELVSVVRNLLRLKEREATVEKLNRELREVVLRRFLPPTLVEAVGEGRVTFDEAPSTLPITVLFADIAGFTPLTERLRAGRIAAFLREYFSAISEEVFAHGGVVDKYLGDGVMVLFGAPLPMPPEEQVRRAVSTASALHRQVARLSERWAEQGFGQIRLRIGLHHGPAATGWFGSPHRTEYTAVGPTVNQAARIEAICEPDATFVSSAVADYLKPEEVISLGLFELRGIPSRQRLFRLVDARQVQKTPLPGIGHRPPPAGPAVHLEAGMIFDRYRVLRKIGEGGLASVWAVRHERLDSQHALKVLHHADELLRERLVTEGRVQASLDPQHIVPVTDVIDVHGVPALVMPLVQGCSLGELLERYRPTLPEAAALFLGILSGVAAAHEASVVHRDLKPSNVLLDRGRAGVVPRVSDFGIAKWFSASLPAGPTREGAFLGTPAYAAPEQRKDASRVGASADLWSLGVILHELLLGARPESDHVSEQALSSLEPVWRAILLRLLSIEPEQRPAAGALLQEVLALLPDRGAGALAADGPLGRAVAERIEESARPDSQRSIPSEHLSPTRLLAHDLAESERAHLERCSRCRVDAERMRSGIGP